MLSAGDYGGWFTPTMLTALGSDRGWIVFMLQTDHAGVLCSPKSVCCVHLCPEFDGADLNNASVKKIYNLINTVGSFFFLQIK